MIKSLKNNKKSQNPAPLQLQMLSPVVVKVLGQNKLKNSIHEEPNIYHESSRKKILSKINFT